MVFSPPKDRSPHHDGYNYNDTYYFDDSNKVFENLVGPNDAISQQAKDGLNISSSPQIISSPGNDSGIASGHVSVAEDEIGLFIAFFSFFLKLAHPLIDN